jgi:ferredoxin
MEPADFLPRHRFQSLFDHLLQQGFEILAPQVCDGAILFRPTPHVDQLPRGVTQQQAPGEYRLQRGNSPRCFGWANGPQALKPLTFVPRETLWRSEQQPDGSLRFHETPVVTRATAIIGVRGCDLAALALQERHFLERIEDPFYRQRRDSLLLIAVDCSHPADTCFCASTGDGPEAQAGFDLALTELAEGYQVRANSARGEGIMRALPLIASDAALREEAIEQAGWARRQQRALPDFDPARLIQQGDHPAWDKVADACLSCGNCTSVCPSCFCHSEAEAPALDGQQSEHQRQWDSCFSEGHSYIHGQHVRPATGSTSVAPSGMAGRWSRRRQRMCV